MAKKSKLRQTRKGWSGLDKEEKGEEMNGGEAQERW